MTHHDTIVALATPSGAGAIAVIRLSGEDAINIASKIFYSISGKDLAKQKTHPKTTTTHTNTQHQHKI